MDRGAGEGGRGANVVISSVTRGGGGGICPPAPAEVRSLAVDSVTPPSSFPHHSSLISFADRNKKIILDPDLSGDTGARSEVRVQIVTFQINESWADPCGGSG